MTTATVIDCRTGQTSFVPLTADQESQRQADAAAASTEISAFVTTTTNRATILQKVNTALVNNATFMGLGAPTNAQTLAQVQSLTKQVNGLVRLIANLLSTAADT